VREGVPLGRLRPRTAGAKPNGQRIALSAVKRLGIHHEDGNDGGVRDAPGERAHSQLLAAVRTGEGAEHRRGVRGALGVAQQHLSVDRFSGLLLTGDGSDLDFEKIMKILTNPPTIKLF